MYSRVPMKLPLIFTPNISSFARPKSETLTWPSLSRRMFSGLRSLQSKIHSYVSSYSSVQYYGAVQTIIHLTSTTPPYVSQQQYMYKLLIAI
jgi:hypothetical protein